MGEALLFEQRRRDIQQIPVGQLRPRCIQLVALRVPIPVGVLEGLHDDESHRRNVPTSRRVPQAHLRCVVDVQGGDRWVNHFSVSGVWLMKGQEQIFKKGEEDGWNYDAEYFSWRKLDHTNATDKNCIESYLNWEGDYLKGREI